ncbi:hypothetical protein ALT1545_10185 [Alteromonas macleodii]
MSICGRVKGFLGKYYWAIEVVGLALILVSFIWEFFVIGLNDKILISNYQQHIETRLDEIHERQFLLQQNLNAIVEQAAHGVPVGAKYLNKEKYHTSHEGEGGKLSKENDGLKSFRAILFMIASVLMIFGKVLEHTFGKDT